MQTWLIFASLLKKIIMGSVHGVRKQPEEGTVMRLLRHPHKYVQHTSDQAQTPGIRYQTTIKIYSRSVKSKDKIESTTKIASRYSYFWHTSLDICYHKDLMTRRIHTFSGQILILNEIEYKIRGGIRV